MIKLFVYSNIIYYICTKYYNMELLIANKVNETDCLEFLSKYGKGELTQSMLRFINQDGDDLNVKFVDWVNWKNKNEVNFGGVPNHISCSLGNRTFINYEWGNLDGWAEIFEYLYQTQI